MRPSSSIPRVPVSALSSTPVARISAPGESSPASGPTALASGPAAPPVGHISRRHFLGALAVSPLAGISLVNAGCAGANGANGVTASRQEGSSGKGRKPRVVVIGAGAFGGWTALHLLRMGAEVTLVDAWGPGNSRASSGGESRVIRAAYGKDRIYSEMVRRAFEQWEELEAVSGRRLYRETGSLWMFRGDDLYIRESQPVLEDLGFPLQEIPLPELARLWPQIDPTGVRSAYLETRAGALAARESCQVVAELFMREGGTFLRAQAEPGEIREGTMTSLRLHHGPVLQAPPLLPEACLPGAGLGQQSLSADGFVFACGPWLGKVFPKVIGERVRPTRQEVYYLGVPRGSSAYGPEALPVWIDFAEKIWYGLPDLHGRGFKIADDTRGEAIDPTRAERSPSPGGLTAARALLGERFPGLRDAPLLEARVCQYENSPDGDLILDQHPAAENVWLLGGGSGHGFKLGPAIGEKAARWVLGEGGGEPRFHLERFTGQEGARTQFDSAR